MCWDNSLKKEKSLSTARIKKDANFQITVEKLKELMDARTTEGVEKLDKLYGGVGNLAKMLNVDLNEGLDSKDSELVLRQKVFGKNKITLSQSKSFWSFVWEALQDKTLFMLEISAFLSLALSFYNPPREDEMDKNPYGEKENKYGMIEAVAILMSIVIIVLVSACNDYSKERQFRELQNSLEKEQKINVLRNKAIVEISISNLVVGDVCIIKYGDVIPGDGILFECNELKIDESSFTGESDLVSKALGRDPFLFYGTHVMEGSGKMLVTAVGVNTQAGVIYLLMKGAEGGSDKEKSVLQTKLSDLALKIGYFGISISIITIIMLTLRFCIVKYGFEKRTFQLYHIKYFVKFIITGITILVVAVPEGLPLAVTLSLAYSVKQMMKDNNLVRHLDACETMGNATTICSDKTGTLTANRMTSVQCYICGFYYKSLSKRTLALPGEVPTILSQNIALNSAFTSRIVKEDNLIKQYGNKTECALLGLLYKIKCDYEKIREQFPQKNFHRIYNFNSTRKFMRTIIKLPNEQGFRLLAKGASEILLKKCCFLTGFNGKIMKLNELERERITKDVIKSMAFNGLRTICLAYKDYLYDNSSQPILANCKSIQPNEEPNWDSEATYLNMTLIAVVGIEDPVRKDVPQAIKKCQKAGITVRMITGDNIDTARSIAIKCGIINRLKFNDDLVLESKEFNRIIRNDKGVIEQERFDRVWPKLRVLARSTPVDKYVLVKHIIQSNLTPVREVVAVTGDGTNDAPALKMADVGFAMGISGTEVAKEASDIILTDDNFSSIVKSVIWGRNVFDSICKFIQFQLTVNIVAVLISFISACVIQESPLKAVQMLWVNLIMDTLGSLALSTEKPSKALLLRKPYGRNKALISEHMMKIIIGNVIYQMVIILVVLFYGDTLFDIDSGINMPLDSPPSVHFTMIFNILVFMTLFNEINARKINGERNVFQGLCSNWIFCTIFLVTSITQVFIIEFGGISFSLVALPLSQWIWCITIGFSMLIWGPILTTLIDKSESYSWISEVADIFSSKQSNSHLKRNEDDGPSGHPDSAAFSISII